MPHSTLIKHLLINGKNYRYYAIRDLAAAGLGSVDRLPFSIRILVENLLRKHDGRIIRDRDLAAIINWQKNYVRRWKSPITRPGC